MYRIQGLLLILLLLSGRFVGMAATHLTLGSQPGTAGNQVIVPVTLNTDVQVVGLQLDAVYDSAQLTASNVALGSALNSSYEVQSSEITAGTRRILLFSDQNLNLPNGELVLITFTIAGSANPGTVTVSLSGVLVANPDADAVATDSLTDGGVVVSEATAVVQARHLFYNDSGFDGTTNADAIATDKQALLPGGQAAFANYSSFSKGINGIIVDIAGLLNPSGIGSNDFEFKVGNSDDTSSWTVAPAPSSITASAGTGTGGSDRIEIEWANNAIQKQWLEVTVLATSDTGLAAQDRFYFGNAIGESGNSSIDAKVDISDESQARQNPRNFLNPAPIDFAMDFNRDAKVDISDENLARSHATNFLTALRLLNLTAPAPDALILASTQGLEGFSQGTVPADGHDQGTLGNTLQAEIRLEIRRESDGSLVIAGQGADGDLPFLLQSKGLNMVGPWRTVGTIEATTNEGAEGTDFAWRLIPNQAGQVFRAVRPQATNPFQNESP